MVVTSSESTVERERLQLNEQLRLRRLLESTNEGLFEVDSEGRCTFITATAARMLGHSADALTGAPMHELIHARSADGSVTSPAECSTCLSIGAGKPQASIRGEF